MKILICGTLPPPKFGHSMLYESLMASSFADPMAGDDVGYDVKLLNMHYWNYGNGGQPTLGKIFLMIKYWLIMVCVTVVWQPKYVLYNESWYPRPFWKDMLFCCTVLALRKKLVIHDHGQYVWELFHSLTGIKQRILSFVLSHIHGVIVLGEKVKSTYDGFISADKVLAAAVATFLRQFPRA